MHILGLGLWARGFPRPVEALTLRLAATCTNKICVVEAVGDFATRILSTVPGSH
jgi:hypothetical protein